MLCFPGAAKAVLSTYLLYIVCVVREPCLPQRTSWQDKNKELCLMIYFAICQKVNAGFCSVTSASVGADPVLVQRTCDVFGLQLQ